MRADLKLLTIARGEIASSSGVDAAIARKPFWQRSGAAAVSLWLGPATPFWLRHLPLGLAAIVGASHGMLVRAIALAFPFSAIALLLELGIGFLLARSAQLLWVRRQIGETLHALLADVDRFNDTLRSIDINDRLEAAGNPEAGLQNRDRVLEVLQVVRDDLVRALRTERILRENRSFIQENPDLFDRDLSTLSALEVSEMASDRGRLLNEALQIAMDAREEVRKMQGKIEPS